MNVLIVGCGRTGAQLANSMLKQGHAVSVVDRSEESFERLDSKFSGMITQGIPIDMSVLKQAGIEQCDAIAVVTHDDNINAMVAQVAKQIFRVSNVVARIQDPLRSRVFTDFGFYPICTTSLAVCEIERLLLGEEGSQMDLKASFDLSRVRLFSTPVPKRSLGQSIADLDLKSDGQLVGVETEEGDLVLLKDIKDRVFQEGDHIVFIEVAN